MKTALVESAWSASRTTGSEFQDRYNRLKPRIGHKRAIMAVAHALALRIHDVLSTGLPYRQARTASSQATVNRLIRHHSRRLRHLHGWLEQHPA
jgi:hypothetical protein